MTDFTLPALPGALDTVCHVDALALLAALPEGSVDCVVTSPPYYGLRDYGVDGQIGLEDTPQAYVKRLADLFREVKRVLKYTGTCWINLGDSYASGEVGRHDSVTDREIDGKRVTAKFSSRQQFRVTTNLPPKSLMGIPWRVAFALQDDGWILRSDIIWHKPNPMPESVTDRPTKAHEYVFLFAKEPRYYYDADAIKEPAETQIVSKIKGRGNQGYAKSSGAGKNPQRDHSGGYGYTDGNFRNKRSVWTIPTKPNPEAHFATYPEELITPMILAGCPANGVVLDPFMGSGTTALVARKLGRRFIGSELNAEYVAIAHRRLAQPFTPSFMNLLDAADIADDAETSAA